MIATPIPVTIKKESAKSHHASIQVVNDSYSPSQDNIQHFKKTLLAIGLTNKDYLRHFAPILQQREEGKITADEAVQQFKTIAKSLNIKVATQAGQEVKANEIAIQLFEGIAGKK